MTEFCGVSNSSNLTENFVHNSTCPEGLSGLMGSADQFMGGGFSAGFLFVIWLIVVSALQRRGQPFLGSVITANLTTMFASFLLYLTNILGQAWPVIWIFITAGTVMFSYLSKRR